MSSERSPSVPQRGLPPVAPPSGKFIAQLFLVPGMIVLLAVLLLLMFRYLFGGGYTTDQFLRQLDNPNADIRWRGASDLAQVLEKSENLPMRTDTAFAFELTRRLKTSLDELDQDEKTQAAAAAKLPDPQKEAVWLKLGAQRKYVTLLAMVTARLRAPVAIPVLAELAQRSSPDPKGETLLRRQALWALGILGDNIRNFGNLPPEARERIVADLQTASSDPARSAAARTALFYLGAGPQADDVVAVDSVLARGAQSDDPYSRELVALALRFWDGPRVEPTLLKLSHDDGHGQLLRVTELD